MPYVLGTDEAGYGPNLGPLVIAASLWHVPDDYLYGNLYELFRPIIVSERAADMSLAVVVADSKKLYSTGRGLGELERGVLAFANTLTRPLSNDAELWQQLAGAESIAQLTQVPWHAHSVSLPHVFDAAEVEQLSTAIAQKFAATGAKLAGLAATVLFPCEFNRLVNQCGNKAEVLSQATLQLVDRLLPAADEPVLVDCDKHGGRGKYAPLLMQQFRSSLVEVLHESRPLSAYRLRGGPANAQLEFRFSMGAEQFMPPALASMTAKYLRELSMLAFNRFWQSHLPGLKPTAGYPQDARRYKVEIAEVQRQLGIHDDLLWRIK
jgi:ribonuclease HII